MSKVKISQMLQLDRSWRSIGCRQHGSTRCRTSLAFSGSFDLQTINQLHEWEKLAKRMIGSFDGDEEADRAQRSFWRHRECMIHYLPSLNVKVFLDEKVKIFVALNVCGNKCTSSISLTIFSPWAHFALKSTLPWGMFPLPCNVKLCMVMTFKCSSQAKGGSIRKTEESLLCQCTVQCSGSGCQCDLGWRFRMNSWFIKTSTERFARLL